MYKEIEVVIKELKELFDVEGNKENGTIENNGSFMIAKKQMERFEVIAKLQKYFDGVGITGGYVEVSPITFVHTSFTVHSGSPY